MNEMDGRSAGLDSYPHWVVRDSSQSANGKYLSGATNRLHDSLGVTYSPPSPGKKEWKERAAEGIILIGSATGFIYGVVLIVQRFVLGG